MKTYITVIAALFLCFFAPAMMAHAGEDSMPRTWFSDRNVTAVEIKQFDYTVDNRNPVNTVHIDDQDAIKGIIHRIEQIPVDGPEFRSFIPKETIEITFVSKQDPQVIRIYNGHFKTPSTGFNTSDEAEKIEALVYKDIISLLAKN